MQKEERSSCMTRRPIQLERLTYF